MTRFQPQGSRITYNQAAPGQTPFKQLYGISRVWASLDPYDKTRIKRLLGLASPSELLELDDMERKETHAQRELDARQDTVNEPEQTDDVTEVLSSAQQMALNTIDDLNRPAPQNLPAYVNRGRIFEKYKPALLKAPATGLSWEEFSNG